MDNTKILFVGLGKLGLSLAAILAQKNNVIGYDINSKLVDDLDSGNFSYVENDVKNFLSKNQINLKFKKELDLSKLNKLEIIFILIPTNTSINGEYSYKNLLDLIKNILNKIKLNKKLIRKKLLINICSTLQPGTYKKYLKPL
jgi:UDP-N-acetyl-D-mannosaminuronate dehydrogenase